MNLSDDLRRQLEQSVARHIGEPPATDTLSKLIGHAAVNGAPGGMNAFRYGAWIVKYALRQPTRDLFVRVVRDTDTGDLVELQALIAELEADSSKWTAPVEGLWIPTRWPFIDRTSLRDALDEMVGAEGPPALAIEGPLGNGKRTMGAYIRHLAERANAFEPVIRELRDEPQPGTLFDIVTELWLVLGEEADLETTHAEPERQATTLARETAVAAQAAPLPVWFVAIVMEHAGLEEGVLKFVDELLRLVQTSTDIAAKLRVLVLCDQLSLLELEHPPLMRHALPEITEVEVGQWLQAVAPGKEAALYEVTATTLVDRLKSQDVAQSKLLRRLAQSCAIAARKLAA